MLFISSSLRAVIIFHSLWLLNVLKLTYLSSIKSSLDVMALVRCLMILIENVSWSLNRIFIIIKSLVYQLFVKIRWISRRCPQFEALLIKTMIIFLFFKVFTGPLLFRWYSLQHQTIQLFKERPSSTCVTILSFGVSREHFRFVWRRAHIPQMKITDLRGPYSRCSVDSALLSRFTLIRIKLAISHFYYRVNLVRWCALAIDECWVISFMFLS